MLYFSFDEWFVAVAEALDSPDAVLASAALDLLAQYPHPQTPFLLAKLLQSADTQSLETKFACDDFYETIRVALQHTLSTEVVSLLKPLLFNRDANIIGVVASVLSTYDGDDLGKEAVTAIEHLEKRLVNKKNADFEVWAAIADLALILGKSTDRRAFEKLVSLLEGGKTYRMPVDVREYTALALVNHGCEAVPYLIEGFKNDQPRVKAVCLQGLLSLNTVLAWDYIETLPAQTVALYSHLFLRNERGVEILMRYVDSPDFAQAFRNALWADKKQAAQAHLAPLHFALGLRLAGHVDPFVRVDTLEWLRERALTKEWEGIPDQKAVLTTLFARVVREGTSDEKLVALRALAKLQHNA